MPSEFLKNSAAICSTGKVSKTCSGQNFVLEADGGRIFEEFHKNFKAIWFLWSGYPEFG